MSIKTTESRMYRNRILTAYATLITGVVCIGFSAIFVKLAGIPGPVSALYRFIIAGVIIIPWWLIKRAEKPSGHYLILIIAGGAFLAFDLALWNTSLLLTTAATATFLGNMAPFWVGLGSLIIFKDRLPYAYWIGLIISLAGMTMLVGTDAIRNMEFNRGDLLAIAASFLYAGYLLTTQRARVRIDTVTFMAISIMSSFIVLLIINLILGNDLIGFSGKTWLILLGLGLISHLCGWLAINYAMGHLKAAPVSVTLLGQAIVTTLVAMPLLGEYLSVHQVLGGILVLGGICFVHLLGKQKKYIKKDITK
ncbi:MAG: DMT family transporter [Chloroflexi bacterium]|nr:DMT family transporter [Chloroflexota bacterium]